MPDKEPREWGAELALPDSALFLIGQIGSGAGSTRRINVTNFLKGLSSGSKTLIGANTAGGTLTLKGSANDDGNVILNPAGGNVELGTTSRASNASLSILTNTSNVPILNLQGNLQWRHQVLTTGAYQLSEIGGAAMVQVARSAVTTSWRVKSTGANSEVNLWVQNDIQTWRLQLVGSDSDRFRIKDELGGTTPFSIDATTPTDTLHLSSAGFIGFGIANPLSKIHINLATEDLEIVDAGSAAATEQDWIQVEVNGVVGYIRVFATK